MQKNYSLYVDELGTTNLSHVQAPYYILSGCTVDQEAKTALQSYSAMIKYKYWGVRYNHVVFHSVEIGRREGDFAIFQNNDSLYNEFLEELLGFLANGNYRMLFVLLDKQKAVQQNWKEVTVLKRTTQSIVQNFITLIHAQKASGKVVIEASNPDRDYYFIKSFDFFFLEEFRKLVFHTKTQKIF